MEYFAHFHSFSDGGLLALRIALAAIFYAHGKMKLAMWKMQPSAQMPAGMLWLMRTLSIAEPLSAVALLTGFLTQLAVIGNALTMIGAIQLKIKVMKVPFFAQNNTGWEFDFLILAAAIALFFLGAGRFSLDHMVFGL